jgi:hypothetical protein
VAPSVEFSIIVLSSDDKNKHDWRQILQKLLWLNLNSWVISKSVCNETARFCILIDCRERHRKDVTIYNAT